MKVFCWIWAYIFQLITPGLNIDFISSSCTFALHVCIYKRISHSAVRVWEQNWSKGLYFLKLRTLFGVYCHRNTNNTSTLLFILPPEHRQPYIRLSWHCITHTFLLLFVFFPFFGGKRELLSRLWWCKRSWLVTQTDCRHIHHCFTKAFAWKSSHRNMKPPTPETSLMELISDINSVWCCHAAPPPLPPIMWLCNFSLSTEFKRHHQYRSAWTFINPLLFVYIIKLFCRLLHTILHFPWLTFQVIESIFSKWVQTFRMFPLPASMMLINAVVVTDKWSPDGGFRRSTFYFFIFC